MRKALFSFILLLSVAQAQSIPKATDAKVKAAINGKAQAFAGKKCTGRYLYGENDYSRLGQSPEAVLAQIHKSYQDGYKQAHSKVVKSVRGSTPPRFQMVVQGGKLFYAEVAATAKKNVFATSSCELN